MLCRHSRRRTLLIARGMPAGKALADKRLYCGNNEPNIVLLAGVLSATKAQTPSPLPLKLTIFVTL